ncbi:MAG: nitrite/sulfite reductase [Gammaproteobacteria bacterium]|nr:nitrite/sulfite reductase [Gammaproteobacteria bacterium]
MYSYTEIDQRIIEERAAQFQDQTDRYLKGELSDDEYLVLRLQNGLYLQRHAPLLRVAIPHGMLNTAQLRKLAYISRHYDKGYTHFSTRQNIQYNWSALEDIPAILQELTSVQMHAIQTSGNCIRNTTSDEYAGVTADEVIDPRPYCEIIREWSTLHPEFTLLPRKFKISVTGSATDRAATQTNDIGVQVLKNAEGETGYLVRAGGGLGRTPILGPVINEFVPEKHLLTYLEAILRVYNRHGRRDNKYKARIKILVKALTPAVFAKKVDEEWQRIKDGPMTLTQEELTRVSEHYLPPAYESLENDPKNYLEKLEQSPDFKQWVKTNSAPHKVAGYAIINISLKATGNAPGDISAENMEAIADLADQFSFGELRATHRQNLVLSDIRQTDLYTVWSALSKIGLATANIGHITDITCCPGGEYCSLANAKSIPVAEKIQRKFHQTDAINEIGELELNISGCMNACSHHHVGHIGILGVDKKGSEFYQVSLGGSSSDDTSLGKILGPAFTEQEVTGVIEQCVEVYQQHKEGDERFLDTYRRIGLAPFKERVYA